MTVVHDAFNHPRPPLAPQALVTRKDGIVMRSAGRAGAPWRILLLAKGKWEPIASMAQRPTSCEFAWPLDGLICGIVWMWWIWPGAGHGVGPWHAC